ncbi:energy-coupling factor transporter ATPase [Methanolobus profundi]|uniref:Energy-coupling factor transport system ATP-binding protein n=1 Tax=Methanolobus profundi TaxID=487685 RepID=A0A1I4R4X2_9EURY|nr:energy-coupling factor transporter ATPase [Methanolobus profundi]SFM47354.1 energy-coupling factor transport system ATP-binding protein [Methanolobus profundi]
MIHIKDISYRYPDNTLAIDSLSLNINKGEFVAIAGKNGCGKSTLLRHMNGLLLPCQGSVVVNGMDTSDPSSLMDIRRTAGMVFQDPGSQFIGMTVEEDVAFGPENLGLSQREINERVDLSLQNVGMEGYRYHTPRSLSGGQKQKVALASVLAMKPDIILFDEVTSMLDPCSRKDILSLIENLHENGTTVVYVTHHLEELVHADRLVVMENGRIVHDGHPREILSRNDPEQFGSDLPPVIELARRLADSGLIPADPSSFPLSRAELREVLCRSK